MTELSFDTSKYPKMFHKPDIVCVGAGWFKIIDALCEYAQWHIDHTDEPCEQVVFRQIKEKFGGLRVYYSGGDSTIRGMVMMAETWASQTCEMCGNPGVTRTSGWISTLCDDHYKEYQDEG